jgi:hypothetical protein
MLTIVCWLWNEGFRDYRPEHACTLRKMIARHLSIQHRFVCIADDTQGFDAETEVIETPVAAKGLGALRSPEGERFPSCYRRLWMFSEEARVLGDRVLLIDVDLVVVKDFACIVNRDEDFVGWRPYRDWGAQMRYGGGIYLLRTGTRTSVWHDFHGATSIAKARSKGFRGSDQAWLSYKLGPNEPYWDHAAGIYSVRDFSPLTALPNGARIVQTNGGQKPWSASSRSVPWIAENWRD